MNNFLGLSYGLTGGGGHLENKICFLVFSCKKHRENCKHRKIHMKLSVATLE